MNRPVSYPNIEVLVKPASRKNLSGQYKIFSIMLLCSLIVHLFIFFKIIGLYNHSEVSVIELSIEDVHKETGRFIPRPKFRPKVPPIPKEIVRQPAVVKTPKAIKPIKVEPVQSMLPEKLMTQVPVPQIPETQPIATNNFSSLGVQQNIGSDYGSAKEYFEMVRFKIESKKRYPLQAKARHREGRTTVRFAITPSGKIEDIKIVKSSSNKNLDDAAIRAIKESSPLPNPPQQYLSENVVVELTLVFELF